MTPEQIERLKTAARTLERQCFVDGPALRALLAEWEKNYADMRRFQRLFIEADHARIDEVERLKAEENRTSWALEIVGDQLCWEKKARGQVEARTAQVEAEHRQELRERTGEYIAAMEQMQAEIERLKADRELLRECIKTRNELGERTIDAEARLDKAEARETRLREALLRRGISPAPCDICGYNGRGYHQPDSHACIAEADRVRAALAAAQQKEEK